MGINYEIVDTVLSYDETKATHPKFADIKNIILRIPNLQINDKELVFVFGFSGSGKSTLLEALGLMNDTIVDKCQGFDGSKIQVGFEPSITNMATLWHNDNSEKLYATRKDYLSFVFQNTVLLPNFSVVDNVILPTLISNNPNYYFSYLKAVVLLSQLNLADLEVNKLPNQVSGGQRQRLAFARAFLPDYQVLFGDEPTGNLDEVNAEHLFQFLKFHIVDDNKCSIIVSHSIDLTLRFADKIVLLSKYIEKKDNKEKVEADNNDCNKKKRDVGCIIEPDNVFIRENNSPDTNTQPHETKHTLDKLIQDKIDEIGIDDVKQYIDGVKRELSHKHWFQFAQKSQNEEPCITVADVLNHFQIIPDLIPPDTGADAVWRNASDNGKRFTNSQMAEKLKDCLKQTKDKR